MEPRRILIVEDEQLIRWSLCRHLSDAGYRVVEAPCGECALERMGVDVDLVLLDLRLPDTDGITLLRTFKTEHPHCPVILMTAFGTGEIKLEAERLGVFRVIDKPFDFGLIDALIEQATAQSPVTHRSGAEPERSAER